MARTGSKTTTSSSKKKQTTPTPPPPTWDERLVDDVVSWRREIVGLVLFLLGVITLLALAGLTQAEWLVWWTKLLRQILGWGAFVVALVVAAAGIHLMLKRINHPYDIHPKQIIGGELLLFLLLAFSHLIGGRTLADALNGHGGGLVGWALSQPLVDFLGPFLAALVYLGLLAVAGMLILDVTWSDIIASLNVASQSLSSWADRIEADIPDEDDEPEGYVDVTVVRDLPETTPARTVVPAQLTAEPKPARQRRSKLLPSIDILEKGGTMGLSRSEVQWKTQRIEETLYDFGLPARVVEVRRGPAVTQFGVEPGYVERPGPDGEIKMQKVRVSQIAGLQRDLTLALEVSRLRIEAPVPGRSVVGIEVPNNEVSLVHLRDMIESPYFRELNSPLAVGLGTDVSGSAVVIDLAKLPHLLIAGTTGSGKSVLINAFITNLVFNNTPDKLKLVMIDPKKVEFMRFNGLPHLIGKVEVDADRAVGVLRWLTAEMDRRYELFSAVGARNLGGYNRKVGKGNGEQQPLPMIGVFIDELADLMHIYPGDVERSLCRLAQMARATGIHLVVATQRPSTDVITGLIKANFPARLSFAVASGTDSRVILDTVGADQLLGRGDMLFLAPDASGPKRIQGVFVSDGEIDRIVAHWHTVMPDHVPGEAPWEPLIAKYALLDETDTLLEAAVDLAKKHDNLSVSFLQRRLRLGYPRAARLMEHLYEMGLVEDPKSGGKTRRTLVDEDDNPLERLINGKENEPNLNES
ncbi:MAG: DNA translocase FtsK 4TM domain-containing protein [Chloroflexota bacterium]